MIRSLTDLLRRHENEFHEVVEFDPQRDHLLAMDFSGNNAALKSINPEDTDAFSGWVDRTLRTAGARYGIGGYGEIRAIYDRSRVFDPERKGEEPRRLHLGVDIWGKRGTKVYSFMSGTIHSFGFNNRFGDYGATLVLLHQLEGIPFCTIYGHLSQSDLAGLSAGPKIKMGQVIGHFGGPRENGNWPPHLHFQVVEDMQGHSGDYPGVCRVSEKERYLKNCPDPDRILRLNRWL